MKRVLYFVPEFPRVSETFIEREISQLIQFGRLDIRVLSLQKASGSTTTSVLDRTTYQRITWPVSFLSGFYFIFKPFRILKAAWLYFNPKGTPSVKMGLVAKLHFFLKSIAYTKLIEKQNPHHIHAHFLSWPSTTAMIASTILKIPYSVSAHARDVFLEGELINQKSQTAKFITICNTYAYNKAVEISGLSDKSHNIFLNYHGIDYKMFETGLPKTRSEKPRVFLGGTRFVEKKGIPYMIEASRILKERGIAHTVDLVGAGPMYEELKKEITRKNLEDTITIHGENKGMPFSQVVEFYKKADIFVFPSIETGKGDVDGVPTVVIEASMAKLPIITTNAGSITDLIKDGESGIIVEQKNALAIADAVELLLRNESLSKHLTENAYKKAVKMFDIEANIKKLEEMLS